MIWHIEGIVIFGYMIRKSLNSPIDCSTNYEGYMIASSSLGTILIVLNIIVTFLRPDEDEDDHNLEIKGIKVRVIPEKIVVIMAVVTLITTIPFMIGHMAMMSGATLCILDRWLEIDQQCKALVMVYVIVITVAIFCVDNEAEKLKIMLICGYSLFAYYLFSLFYLIYGFSLFFRAINSTKVLNKCPDEQKMMPYILALSIVGTIFTIINLIISWLRPA